VGESWSECVGAVVRSWLGLVNYALGIYRQALCWAVYLKTVNLKAELW